MSETTDIIDGKRTIDGKLFWADGKGGWVPDGIVPPQKKLQDEMVRKILGYAEPLSAEVARFKQHCFDDVDAMAALLDQEYNAKPGGQKGNMSFITVDGLVKVSVSVADSIMFGPELQTAKKLVDECVASWSKGADEKLVAVVNRAFQTDKEGQINRANLLYLLRWKIDDERWERATEAIKDSMHIVGSKRYVLVHKRKDFDSAWEAVSINMAKA